MGVIAIRNKRTGPPGILPNGYTTWLEYWEMQKGRRATRCEALHCKESAASGGLVMKVGRSNNEYILPLCAGHHNKTEMESFDAYEENLAWIA